MPKKQNMKEMQAELARLNAFIAENEGTPSTGSFGRVIGWRNDANSEEYGTEYSYMEFVDSNGAPLGSPQASGDEEAIALFKEIKKLRYGGNKRGKARFDKAVKAWSIQTEHVPSFVVMGKKNKAGKFTATK